MLHVYNFKQVFHMVDGTYSVVVNGSLVIKIMAWCLSFFNYFFLFGINRWLWSETKQFETCIYISQWISYMWPTVMQHNYLQVNVI